MRYPSNILEEELKNKVGDDFFHRFDYTEIIEKIDFAVKDRSGNYFLWAEAKKNATDIIAMLAQLVLTIGKARTFNEVLPPKFLGCFDCEKIAFVPYSDIQDIFHQNDFNWNVAPSNRESKEFKQIYKQIDKIINNAEPYKTYRFDFEKEEKDLKLFILKNFMPGGEISKIKIDKNNFISVYAKWLEAVKPAIQMSDWGYAKKMGIIDGDFYLADLLSAENKTLKEKLFVVLRQTKYVMNRHKNEMGLFTSTEVEFTDKQKAHRAFWAIYERQPREDYWDYIIERRDLLVPQDVRERKGSFFTPKIWVELSQKYIADVLGENWQEEYYVWDCAAGTGNLLAGLTNKRNIWASTLDNQDVDVMRDRIRNGANLFEDNVFQFDFLNDDFGKLPKGLRDIIDDTEKRKKLLIYINPPYAEIAGNKIGVNLSKIHDKYHSQLSGANRELFAQFLIRIYNEIPNCKIGEFSKLKTLSGSHFKEFRNNFKAKLTKAFIVPADTFNNVSGQFPIGFKIWNAEIKDNFKEIILDVFDENGNKSGTKGFYSYEELDYFSKWVNSFKLKSNSVLGWLEGVTRNDFQSQNGIIVLNKKEQIAVPRGIEICDNNLMKCCICFAVRKVIPATWLNDRDQFLYPNDGWEADLEFQSDCLVYTLFNNNISSKHGTNHWIPFTEEEANNSRKSFDSHFMTDFIAGKIKMEQGAGLFGQNSPHPLKLYGKQSPARSGELNTELNIEPNSNLDSKLKIEPNMSDSKFPSHRGVPALPAGCAAEGGAVKFSSVAKNVFNAGKELWRYYHAQFGCDVNAGLYDIREHFQGRNEQGKMNAKSDDKTYSELIGNLRAALKALARKIEPKVYEHGFLR